MRQKASAQSIPKESATSALAPALKRARRDAAHPSRRAQAQRQSAEHVRDWNFLVFGATSSIGQDICSRLVAGGARVAVVDPLISAGRQVVSALRTVADAAASTEASAERPAASSALRPPPPSQRCRFFPCNLRGTDGVIHNVVDRARKWVSRVSAPSHPPEQQLNTQKSRNVNAVIVVLQMPGPDQHSYPSPSAADDDEDDVQHAPSLRDAAGGADVESTGSSTSRDFEDLASVMKRSARLIVAACRAQLTGAASADGRNTPLDIVLIGPALSRDPASSVGPASAAAAAAAVKSVRENLEELLQLCKAETSRQTDSRREARLSLLLPNSGGHQGDVVCAAVSVASARNISSAQLKHLTSVSVTLHA